MPESADEMGPMSSTSRTICHARAPRRSAPAARGGGRRQAMGRSWTGGGRAGRHALLQKKYPIEPYMMRKKRACVGRRRHSAYPTGAQ